jgi:hypothetical protein
VILKGGGSWTRCLDASGGKIKLGAPPYIAGARHLLSIGCDSAIQN